MLVLANHHVLPRCQSKPRILAGSHLQNETGSSHSFAHQKAKLCVVNLGYLHAGKHMEIVKVVDAGRLDMLCEVIIVRGKTHTHTHTPLFTVLQRYQVSGQTRFVSVCYSHFFSVPLLELLFRNYMRWLARKTGSLHHGASSNR